MTQLKGRKSVSFLLLATVLLANFTAPAQGRRGGGSPNRAQTASGQTKTNKKTCDSGYSGTIRYTKTVVTGSTGKFGSRTDMKRVYQANLFIRDDGRQMGSVTASADGVAGSFNFKAQADASENETFEEIKNTEGEDFCTMTLAGGKDKRHYKCSSTFKRQSGAQGTGESSVYIGLRGRKMHLSLTNLPKLVGQAGTSSASSCSGTCTPDKPVNSSRSAAITNGGERSAAADDDAIEFDPANFNRLSGSWTRRDESTTETFEWNLSRCAPPLEVGDLAFEHRRVKGANDWTGIDPLSGTYDGNIVRIKAKVFNNGGDTVYTDVKFTETISGEPLPNGTVSIAVRPGEARQIEYEWDTSGFAWNEGMKNQSEREIKVEIEGDAETGKIKILPKPVILVHGLWSNAAAWSAWHGYLREAHSFAWEAFPVGEDPEHGRMNTGDHFLNYDPTNSIFQNAQELGKQIKWVREQKNAWHVDLVAHSMGGLISRFYIHNFMAPVFDGRPEAAHLVMLGTPNEGSACADLMYWTFDELGDKPVEALRQLKPSVVAEFNRKTFDRKNVKFSILAGYGAGPTCGIEVGDGVVPLSSALYNLNDRGYALTHHLALTDEKYFKSFVMPRIAVGPKKAKSERASAALDRLRDDRFALAPETKARGGPFAGFFQNASYKNGENPASGEDQTDDDAKHATIRQAVRLGPNESKEIEIPVRAGSGAGVVLLAMPSISAVLKDANGTIVGRSAAKTDGPSDYFRTIAMQGEIKEGMWKLKLENAAPVETIVLAAGFTNAGPLSSFTLETGKATPAGAIPLIAKWTENSLPVLNAKITGRLVGGGNAPITFYDDGKHGDGAANDGVYGSSVEKLSSGDHFVEARAEASNQTRTAVALVTVGSKARAPAKTTDKPRRGR